MHGLFNKKQNFLNIFNLLTIDLESRREHVKEDGCPELSETDKLRLCCKCKEDTWVETVSTYCTTKADRAGALAALRPRKPVSLVNLPKSPLRKTKSKRWRNNRRPGDASDQSWVGQDGLAGTELLPLSAFYPVRNTENPGSIHCAIRYTLLLAVNFQQGRDSWM